MKIDRFKLIGIILFISGLVLHFTILPEAYGFISGALIGAGLGMTLFLKRKKA
ncbi:hypothetical protein [Salegentibacter mishustinae]|jgi:uncharacterized membrane-anchored protein|uniref:hypothetical protein n=1 Tax=Salegentibacter mishustinae TaxID=270918 RepID=UPI0024933520|nr:hypothetical protein [Salegentibacter mishustinae]MDX1427443.1 hypothetical protein [Salegentibacter mishustinae]|tara:strand:- start:467 stop:625 length:159 start_codon:yes stop_codon:yes gene_type:complete